MTPACARGAVISRDFKEHSPATCRTWKSPTTKSASEPSGAHRRAELGEKDAVLGCIVAGALRRAGWNSPQVFDRLTKSAGSGGASHRWKTTSRASGLTSAWGRRRRCSTSLGGVDLYRTYSDTFPLSATCAITPTKLPKCYAIVGVTRRQRFVKPDIGGEADQQIK